MKKLIGIIGKKQSGKDTIADYLVQNHGFIKYSYAFPLKNGAMEIFGFTKEQVYGDLKDVVDSEWGVTPRKVLQIMGTELFQYDLQKYIPEFANIGRSIWVKRFSQWYKNNNDKDVIIADVRFKHEVDGILQNGGEIWKVIRIPYIFEKDVHASEVELDNIDEKFINYIIINDDDLDSLYKKISEKIDLNRTE